MWTERAVKAATYGTEEILLDRFLEEAEMAALSVIQLPALTGLRAYVRTALSHKGCACFSFRASGDEREEIRFARELLRFFRRAEGDCSPEEPEEDGAGERLALLLRCAPERDCFVLVDRAHLLPFPGKLVELLEDLMSRWSQRLHLVLLAPCPIAFLEEADLPARERVVLNARDFILEWSEADECLRRAYPQLLDSGRRQVFDLCGGWASAMDALMERLEAGGLELGRLRAWSMAGHLPALCALLEDWTRAAWKAETLACMEGVCVAAELPEELARRLTGGGHAPLAQLAGRRFLVRCDDMFEPVYVLNAVLQSWLYHRAARSRGRGFLLDRHGIAVQYGQETEHWRMVFSHQLRRGYAEEAALTLRQLSFSELDATLLEEYLDLVRRLPAASIARLPWVQLGCAIAMKYRYPTYALQYLDSAIETFRAVGDREGVVLGCCQKISMGFFSAEQKGTAVEFLRILEEDRPEEPPLEPLMEGYRKVFTAYAILQRQGADYPRAIALLEEAARIAILKENHNLRLWACFVRILTYKDCQYSDGIPTALNEALELAEAPDVQKPLKMCLYQAVAFLCYVEAGQYGEACACCERAARIANEIEAFGYSVYINMVHAYALDCLKRFDKAERVILETERVSRTILNVRSEHLWSYYLIGQSYHYFLKGEKALALDTAEKAVCYARRSGRVSYMIRGCLVLGNILVDQGACERAEALAWECLALCQGQKYKFYHVSARFLLAQVYRMRGHTEQFAACFCDLAEESRAVGIYHFNFARPEVICAVLDDYKGGEKERGYLRRLRTCNETGAAPSAGRNAGLLPRKPVCIRIFGRLTAETGGRTLEPCASGKAMQLLRMLALQDEPVAILKVLEALWPEGEEKSAMNNFYFVLHQLRGYLGRKDAVLYKRGRCSLNEALVEVDARSFETLVRVGREYLTAGNHPAAAVYYEQAALLYQGPVLDGEELPDEAVVQREAVEREAFKALREYGAALIKLNLLDQAEEILSKAMQSAFSDERCCRLMMKAQYFSGNKNGAMMTYERLCRQLWEELGVEPHRLTKELADQIRHNRDLSAFPE